MLREGLEFVLRFVCWTCVIAFTWAAFVGFAVWLVKPVSTGAGVL